MTSGPVGNGLKGQAQLVGAGGGDDAGVRGGGQQIAGLPARRLRRSVLKIGSIPQ